jgi:hypothetical protein
VVTMVALNTHTPTHGRTSAYLCHIRRGGGISPWQVQACALWRGSADILATNARLLHRMRSLRGVHVQHCEVGWLEAYRMLQASSAPHADRYGCGGTPLSRV